MQAAPTSESELRGMIARQVRAVCLERYGAGLRSIVLTGSVARDEATVAKEEGRRRVMGDAELFLVFRDSVCAPAGDELRALCSRVEVGLRDLGVICRVELTPVFARYFRSLKPSIFAYELRACGKTVWGEDCLRLIPPAAAAAPPFDDAFRLVWNRLIELFGVLGSAPFLDPLPVEAGYAAAKLYLDLTTSILVFTGRYRPTYRARAEEFVNMVREAGSVDVLPVGHDFVERVVRCTGWKLSGEGPRQDAGFCLEALRDTHSVLQWELRRLTACPPDMEDARLWDRWRRSQPLSGRIRGWIYVLRAKGWHRSCLCWPHWLCRAWVGSPRTCVYGVARELLLYLQNFGVFRSGAEKDLAHIASGLPCPANRVDVTCRDLCRDVFRNYREFLVNTRC